MEPTLRGRDDEIQAISEMLDRVGSGGSSMVVAGDPGIGKTALIQAARKLAESSGFAILETGGVQSEADLPYSGLQQLISPVAGEIGQLPEAQKLALQGALGMGESTEDDPYMTGLAVLTLLGDVAEDKPLLVVAEDAHWLDRGTSAALAFVGRRLEADSIVLLLTTRGNPPHPIRMARFPTLELAPLDQVAALELLTDRAPDLKPADQRVLLEQASGNPLALVELPIDLEDQAASPLPDWLPLSTRLERAFAARFSELPPVTRSALVVAALEDGGDVNLILETAGTVLDEEVLVDSLEPAFDAGLAHSDGKAIRFRHPLVRHAVRQGATAGMRQEVHLALANALEDQPERALWHRVAASVGPDEELAEALAESAETARRRGSVLTSIRVLERAAEISGPETSSRYLLDGAELALEIGRIDLVATLTGRAAEGEVAAVDHDRRDWLLEMAGHDPLDPASLHGLVDRSERLLAAGDLARGTETLVTVAFRCWWSSPPRDLRQRVVETSELLRETSRANQRLLVLSLVDPFGHGAVLVDELTALDPSGTDPRDLRLLAVAAAILGAFDRAVVFSDVAVARLRAGGGYGTLVPALVARAWAGVFVGEWDTAQAAADEASRMAMETGQPLWAVSASAASGALNGLRRSEDAALGLVGLAEAILPPGLADGMWTLMEAARGLTALAAGRTEDASEHLGSVVKLDPAAPGAYIGTWLVGTHADACVRSGRSAEAEEVIERFAEVAERSRFPYLEADVPYAKAVLSEPDQAGDRFDAAAKAAAQIPLLRARVELARGMWLRRQGEDQKSRAPLRAARDACDALGASVLGDVAREELRGAGEASRGDSASRRHLLTPQELQIAEMAASGKTNREIGEQLFLSHRTVGSHLYRIFPKLGIVSRGELRDAIGAPAQPV